MKHHFINRVILGLFFITAISSCKSKKLNVNPGAYVTVDGTDDGLQHVQRDFKGASRTNEGILVTFESDVLFPLNSSYLTEKAKLELDKLIRTLSGNKDAVLLVDGHTDATGTKDYNKWLSEKRAESVKNYLVEKGLSSSKIQTKGFGQDKPVAPNNTHEGRQKNRRVEVTIK